ncbi:MAG: hypothetical protein Q9N02_04750 [Ghiorsea sp.]|nr:hypothetical protein [Ghiorsea sp.]
MQEQTRDLSKKAVHALKQAVHDALEKKQKLGQYAVIDCNGKPTHVSSSDLSALIKQGKP